MAFMAETMKRVMKACLLLAVTMILLFAFHLNAFADSYTFTDSNGISWSYTTGSYEGSSCAVINGCGEIPESGEITVPGYINGLPVIIGDNAFKGNLGFKSATLSEGIIGIGSSFNGCANLQSVEMPSTLVYVGEVAFNNCRNLTDVRLNEGLRMIRGYAFSKCSSLASINIPSTVEAIYTMAFDQCSSLDSINVDDSNNAYKDIDGVLISRNIDAAVGDKLFYYPLGKTDESYTIPDGVKVIGNMAFYKSQLKEVTIPASVRELENNAFQKAENLQNVNIAEGGMKTLGSNAFSYCSSLQSIDIPQTVNYIGSDCFSYCSSLRSVTLPDGLTDIKSGTFRNTIIDQSFVIPASVKNIEWQAFNRCTNLQHLIIPDNVERINEEAFKECMSLQDVYIANENIIIDNNAFLTCGPYDPDQGKRLFTITGDPESAAAEYAGTAGIDYAPTTAAEYMEAMAADGPLPAYDFGNDQTGDDPGTGGNNTSGSGSNGTGTENGQNGTSGNSTFPAVNKTNMTGTATVAPSQKIVNTNELKRPKFKAKSKKGKKVKLSWSKVSNADGYLIYVKGPKDKKFKCRVTKSARVKSITHKGLKKGKKYKYKVAAYKLVNGVMQKGPFSKTITVKIKK